MSVVRIASACLDSGSAVMVRAEVDIQRGLPLFTIIGLPDRRIDEAKLRIRSAIKNSGFPFPTGRITVSLTPSSVHKQGTGLDLAIALGVLAAARSVPVPSPNLFVFGELSLDGSVVECVNLSSLLACLTAPDATVMVPSCQSGSISSERAIKVLPVHSLREAVESVQSGRVGEIPARGATGSKKTERRYAIDAIVGNDALKRAVVIALSGKHNLFLRGPAGSGKTMIAHAAAELLPPLRPEELQALSPLYAAVGKESGPIDQARPFRAPHCGVTRAALLGGGQPLVPGEISLASYGLLFLDEFPEINRSVRDSLRQPLQEKEVRFSRRGRTTRFVADCMVWSAMNDCPCGLTGVPEQTCQCKPSDKMRYARGLPDPLADRFPMFFTVPYLTGKDWKRAKGASGVQGKEMAISIERCWREDSQEQMWALPLTKEAESVIWQAVDRLRLSMRSRVHLERVAQTIAFLAGDARVDEAAVNEALQYRRRRT